MAAYKVECTVLVDGDSDDNYDDKYEDSSFIIDARPNDAEPAALREAFGRYLAPKEGYRRGCQDMSPLDGACHHAKQKGEASFTVRIDDKHHKEGHYYETYYLSYKVGSYGRELAVGLDKSSLCRLTLRQWRPPTNRFKVLVKLSQKQLADLVCRLEATR